MPEFDSTIQYRNVEGFPGYRVGSDGSVWSCWHPIMLGWRYGSKWIQGSYWKRLAPGTVSRLGHQMVMLRPRKNCAVHRLVLEAFVGPCPSGMQCCHYDGDGSNNHLSNLRWGTPKSNQADRIRHGTDCRGSRHPNAKLTEADVRAIRTEYAAGGVTQRSIGEKYGVDKDCISIIITRKAWKHVQ